MPGAAFLSAMVEFAVKKFGFDPDAFVHELVDSIIGDNYPVPDRMLVHNERIVHEYLMWAMCGEPRPPGKFDLYAVEGGTAAMCYIFKSLKANRLLFPGDTIALGTPIFTPYLEMTHLEDYDLKVVNIAAPQENRFQYTDEEIKKLEDPKIKAFFIVNPGNPTGMAMSKETIAKIVNLVKTKRPDLMLLTDDVYGTFVDGLPLAARRAAAQHDRRLLLLEVFRLHRLAARRHRDPRGQHLRQDDRQAAGRARRRRSTSAMGRSRSSRARSSSSTASSPTAATSALNHTAGLSLPQQVMMTHVLAVRADGREEGLPEGLHGDRPPPRHGDDRGPRPRRWTRTRTYDAYYGLIDFEFWARKNIGDEAVEYLKKNVHPLDLAFRLAEDHGIVLLNGGGFEAPDWSLRVSLANLPDEAYEDIGRGVRAIARGYRDAYEASKGAPKKWRGTR